MSAGEYKDALMSLYYSKLGEGGEAGDRNTELVSHVSNTESKLGARKWNNS